MVLVPSTTLPTYYVGQSTITDPHEYAGAFDALPDDMAALCKVVQGLLLHYAEGAMYGVEIPDHRMREADTRDVAAMLAHILAWDDRPLTVARPPEMRLVGCCRDYAVLLCAMLRHRGVPARVRFGFSTYFHDPVLAYCDHVVCEYWRAAEERWVLVDAQQDDLHCRANRLTFDPHDVPHDQLVLAGRAWQECRAGRADPDSFGYDANERGMPVVQNYLVHDLAALNKVELLIWDCWGLGERRPGEDVAAEDVALLDRVAALTLSGDDAFQDVRAIYEGNTGLRVPPTIKSQALDTAH